MALSQSQYQQWVKLASWASLVTASLLIVGKLYAWGITESASLMAALADSLLDLVASGMNFFVLRYALEPADNDHRFGHGKAEALAGLGQAAFICGSSVLLIFHAIGRIYRPVPIQHVEVGIWISVFSVILTLLLVLFQRWVINKTHSVAIKADSLHYQGDLLLNSAVLCAIWLAAQGIEHADAVFAIGIAIFLLFNAWSIAVQSGHNLMDRELSTQEQQLIVAIARSHPEVKGTHQLRTRQAGATKFIQIHLTMDDDLTLFEAHQISDEVEAQICAQLGNVDMLIHADPVSVGID